MNSITFFGNVETWRVYVHRTLANLCQVIEVGYVSVIRQILPIITKWKSSVGMKNSGIVSFSCFIEAEVT